MSRQSRIRNRTRMIFDLPPAVQMAIRLRATKSRMTTAEVVRGAIEKVYPQDLQEANSVLAESPDESGKGQSARGKRIGER